MRISVSATFKSTIGDIQQYLTVSHMLKSGCLHNKMSQKGQHHDCSPLFRSLHIGNATREKLIVPALHMYLDAMCALLVEKWKISAFDRFD
ncbi:hypothetical protein Y032_0385g428 [Ancylostoma ceylanicum]|uniref:Uncharacterized protein n=1 Tax=Ancylostoma ceylanicum TaxID=53326 RepID=A0A016RSL7_9BILA|nr:hypothetical protein Y032_0385g428 [Ancylostoma ceylanicum]